MEESMSGMKVGQRVTLNFKGRSITATVVKIEPSEQVEQSELPPVLARYRSARYHQAGGERGSIKSPHRHPQTVGAPESPTNAHSRHGAYHDGTGKDRN